MKYYIYLLLPILFLSIYCIPQRGSTRVAKDIYNFDFEEIQGSMPMRWKTMGDTSYTFSLDSINKISGKYSASIGYSGDDLKFGAWGIAIPYSFVGKKITLSGYLKTENVEGSHAGLWMRIDPDIGFNNMSREAIKGTNDWKKCEITLELTADNVSQIVIGGILVGKGKMWIDDLKVQIDGTDIELLEPMIPNVFPAERDTIFAKSSLITTEVLDKLSNRELINLGLIWGYLKYYHPAIQQGQFNWDAELFRMMERLCNTNSQEEKNALYIKWIDGLGQYQEAAYNIDDHKVKLYPDLDWITTADGLSKALSDKLLGLKNAKRKNQGYYIRFTEQAGNPVFCNEIQLDNPYPDAGYRLLALYRYWNMIQYFYPNRHLIGKSWESVLMESIPLAIKAKDGSEYVAMILGVINQLNDTHANLVSTLPVLSRYLGMKRAIPKLAYIDGRVVVTGYFNDSIGVFSPLRIGDEILSVNNKPVEQLIQERMKVCPASNYPRKFRDIAQGLLRSNEDRILVSFSRNQQIMSGEMLTYIQSHLFSFQQSVDTCFQMFANDIAYLNMGNLKSRDLNNILKDVEQTKGLIVDLRCYPSDSRSMFILGNFLVSKPTDFFKMTVGSAMHPGLFVFEDGYKFGRLNFNPYRGKVVVLVNEETISMAEFAAMLFQAAPRTIVIGSTTAGADGNVSRINLPGGLITNISGIGIYYPDGRETQRVGIVPDIEVKSTINGVRTGHDDVLERAILYIKSNVDKK